MDAVSPAGGGKPGIAGHFPGRVLLVVITLWALAMVVPDLHRLSRPLASFGFSADNNGVVNDVQGPFAAPSDSPAFAAGVRLGDRLDLTQMRCLPLDTLTCTSTMAALGGFRLVINKDHIRLALAATSGQPARTIDIVAKPRVPNHWVRIVLLLDQAASIAVILAAAWLVWSRPGLMTWGFFLYVIWFNPGQSNEFYAWLLHTSPAALLAQDVIAAIAQGAGLAGFIWFAVRAPNNATTPRWRPVERALPFVGIVLAILLTLSYANLFGFPTETITRAGIMSGFVVAACVFLILLARRKELPPQDYQRLRWVIWGCLIGLPALVIADIGTQTSLFDPLYGGSPPPEHFWGMVYLVNGVLCLFVSEAVRRPYVVSVGIPLRRVTILGVLLSLPTLLLHREVDHVRDVLAERFTLPAWFWLAVATAILFLMSKIHETAVHSTDRFFHRSVAKAGERLGNAILRAGNHQEIETHLVQGVHGALGLASASLFREQDNVFRRTAADQSWDETAARVLEPNDPMLEPAHAHRPFNVNAKAAGHNRLPEGLQRPILAVPVGDQLRCLALALYGPHVTGNDLNQDERAMLAELADKAASAMTKLNEDELRERIALLEDELQAIAQTAGTVAS